MFGSVVRTAVAVSVISLLSAQAAAQSATVAAQAIQTLACYSNAGSLALNGSWTYQSSGYCKDQCVPGSHRVMAITQGSTCYCGDELPADSYQVSSSKCNSPCDGFDQETCGGNGYWQFYLTGLGDPEQSSSSSSSSSSTHNSPSSTNSISVVTQAGQTIIVTASATGKANNSGGGSGSTNKIGIAVGVVVGLLVVASIVGGIVLFLKRRRIQAIEEEHRRNAAVSSFVSTGKSETSSLPDQRLDASAIAARRQSIGSIADEMDYSRRILQVRNPDRESRASAMA